MLIWCKEFKLLFVIVVIGKIKVRFFVMWMEDFSCECINIGNVKFSLFLDGMEVVLKDVGVHVFWIGGFGCSSKFFVCILVRWVDNDR